MIRRGGGGRSVRAPEVAGETEAVCVPLIHDSVRYLPFQV